MEALGMYLLKASAIMALFLGSYQLLLRRETHFRLNRIYLLAGLVASLSLPFIRISKTVTIPLVHGPIPASTSVVHLSPVQQTPFDWEPVLLTLYILGALTGLILLLRQLWQLMRLIRSENPERMDDFVYIPTRSTQAPFSFFKYIFYNPDRHSPRELPMILAHEKAHGSQYHSLDILFGRIVTVVLWINPLSWWYQKSIEQNLEFLADAAAIRHTDCPREYQYTLLKVSGNPVTPTLATPFYSSLIKNRIIMLNTRPTQPKRTFKHLLIIPVLALFLMAFGRETVYEYESPLEEGASASTVLLSPESQRVIELTIDKNTSDKDLADIKEKLAGDGIDFSYTVVRNEAGEILSMEFDFSGQTDSGEAISGSYAVETDGPIDPIAIRIDDSGNVSIREAGSPDSGGTTIDYRDTSEDAEDIHEGTDTQVWVYTSGQGEHETIELRKKGGHKVLIVDGEEVDTKSLEKDGEAKKIFVRIKELEDDPENKVEEVRIHEIRITDEDGEERIHEIHPGKGHAYEYRIEKDTEGKTDTEQTIIIHKKDAKTETVKLKSKELMFINMDDKEDMLVFLDGEKTSKRTLKNLDPERIETIEVLKGDRAIEKYGNKAKDGVILITTKK